MSETGERLFWLVEHNREHLRSLLPEEEADRVIAEVEEYLSSGPEAAVKLRRLLQKYEPVREWLDEALYGDSERYFSLGGDSEIPPLSYVCPCRGCDYGKIFPQVPDPAPVCPAHGVPLVLSEEKGFGRECS